METSPSLLVRTFFEQSEARVMLPWVADSQNFFEQCTACGLCASRCPEQIITLDESGYPGIDFSNGACSFCIQCLEVCPEPLFDLSQPPWEHVAVIMSNCLVGSQLYCSNCAEVCPVQAIEAEPNWLSAHSRVPSVNEDQCTGCGACITACPNDSIRLSYAPIHQNERLNNEHATNL